MSETSDCVFCRVVAGDLPADVVHADEDVVVFRDVAPKAEVHLLTVPRHHVADVVALQADERLLAAVVRAGAVAARGQGHEEFRLVFNTGASAGQTVFHAHGHVLAGRGAATTGL